MALDLRHPLPRRRRAFAGTATLVACLTVLPQIAPGPAWADTSPGPTNLPHCVSEQYPAPGASDAGANVTKVPYEIPFTATLGLPGKIPPDGGYLEVNNPKALFEAVLGGPIIDGTGGVFAQACGVLQLPSEIGGINGNPLGSSGNSNEDQYNNNFVFQTKIPTTIELKGIPVPIITSYSDAIGNLGAAISPQPAANGGLDVTFIASAKSTAILDPGALTELVSELAPGPLLTLVTEIISELGGKVTGALKGGECSLALGNLTAAGVPSSYFGTGAGQTGLVGSANTTPVVASTGKVKSEPVNSSITSGQPVTGPITNAQAVLVANDFPIAAVVRGTPPAPTAPNATNSPASLCSATFASLFNMLLGLPSPAGDNLFYAPGKFAVFTSS